jgi:putative serine protease PepD
MTTRTTSTLAALATAALLAGCGSDAAPTPSAPAGDPTASGFTQVVARALPSVVQIRSARGLGSGIVFDTGGHVVTNAHVVAGSRTFRVTTADGSTHNATLRGVFPQGDLAVVEVSGARLRPATFGDSARVRTGEYALAIGNPLGLRSSVTQGIVSSTSRTVSEGNGVALPSVIQTSAAINPGNSGGALVDATGAVIGVPTLAALDPEFGNNAAPGIGFAISSNTVKSIARQLIANGRVTESGRASLGVELQSLPSGAGAMVVAVVAHGAAAAAGLTAGEVITKIGSAPTPTVDAVALALATRRPGQRVAVTVGAPGGTRTLQVTLGQVGGGN